MVLRGVSPPHAPRDSLYLVKVGGIFAGNLLLHESPYIFDWVQIRAVPRPSFQNLDAAFSMPVLRQPCPKAWRPILEEAEKNL